MVAQVLDEKCITFIFQNIHVFPQERNFEFNCQFRCADPADRIVDGTKMSNEALKSEHYIQVSMNMPNAHSIMKINMPSNK
jgi:hypothetical protein